MMFWIIRPFRAVIQALVSGVVSVDDLIDSVYQLDKLNDALDAAHDRETKGFVEALKDSVLA